MKRTLFLATIVASIVALISSCRVTGIEQLSRFPAAQTELPAEFTLVNWNVHKGTSPQIRDELRALVRRESPDLLFLQEAKADLYEADPSEEARLGGFLARSWRYPWPRGDTVGVSTLSRVAPRWVESVPTQWRELIVTAPKASLVAEYPVGNGATLLVVNVHCMNFERWGTRKLRSQLADLQRVMARHDGPILLAGDFNTWNQRRLALIDKLANDLRLREVEDFDGQRMTGARRWRCANWLLGIDKELPLDRVYYRGLVPGGATVLGYESSDHKALRVTFSVARASQEANG